MILSCRQRILSFKVMILTICIFLSLYWALLIRTTLTVRTSRPNPSMQRYHLLRDVHTHVHKEVDIIFSRALSTFDQNGTTDFVSRKTVMHITNRGPSDVLNNEVQYESHTVGQKSTQQSQMIPNKTIHHLDITMSTTSNLYSKQRNFEVSAVQQELRDNSNISLTRNPSQSHNSSLMRNMVSSKKLQYHQPTAVIMKVNKEKALLYGNLGGANIEKRFLTIGIVSVRREGVSYLEETVASIINTTTNFERKAMRVVILIADQDHNVIIQRANKTLTTFKSYIESGFITIIQPDMNVYPNFSSIKLTLNDSRERVEWRSKQNVDYAYIFLFCQALSKYYLHLEDDVIAAPNFMSVMKSFLMKRNRSSWFVLHLSKIGFIGKLFKAKDLKHFAEYILRFFSDQPCDMLLDQYRLLMNQKRRYIKIPTMFQHYGVISSLKGKKQLVIDTLFKDNHDMLSTRKRYHLLNPSAKLYTTMHSTNNASLMFAYGRSDKMYSVVNVSVGEYLAVHFRHPQNISRIYVETGFGKVRKFILPNGEVYISQDKTVNCSSVHLGPFVYGIFDTKKAITQIPTDISCLSIIVTQSVKNRVVFKEIAIFTADGTNQ